jgi:hypothetical protein
MSSKATSCALKRDILEWQVPEEVLSVLLKDRTTGDFAFPKVHTLCKLLSLSR